MDNIPIEYIGLTDHKDSVGACCDWVDQILVNNFSLGPAEIISRADYPGAEFITITGLDVDSAAKIANKLSEELPGEEEVATALIRVVIEDRIKDKSARIDIIPANMFA
jgi:hypothetical protein